jgi:hypothetical protein
MEGELSRALGLTPAALASKSELLLSGTWSFALQYGVGRVNPNENE